jgi:hypothetical protein
MNNLTEVEPSMIHLTLQEEHLVEMCILICEIGIILHTSANICAWNTYVHLT